MVVLEHFATYTNLPIRINDVAGFIKDRAFVEHIIYNPRPEDPRVLAGMLLHRKIGDSSSLFEYIPAPYSVNGTTVANIVYSTLVPSQLQRVIICKELIHICDHQGSVAKAKEHVERLISEILTPIEALLEIAHISQQFASDRSGLLLSLAVLLPRDARAELKPHYDAGTIGDEEIASIAQIPEVFVRLVMSDEWTMIMDRLCPN